MNDDPRRDLTPEETQAQEAIQKLATVKANADFRSRMKQSFLDSAASAATERKAPARPARVIQLWGAGLAAAAVILLAIVFTRGSDQATWSVVAAASSGSVTIDGVVHDLSSLDASTLKPGATWTTDADSKFMLQLGKSMVISVTPSTSFVLNEPPREDDPDHLFIDVVEGEVAMVTGPDYTGVANFQTSEAVVHVVGTTVSVWRNPDGTCVCVIDGSVDIDARLVDESKNVTEGFRWVLMPDGSTMDLTPIVPPHQATMEALRAQAQKLFSAP